MSTFVDTSALLALLDADEQRHSVSAGVWRHLLDQDEVLVTTNYVLIESFALVERRLGFDAVRVLVGDFVPLLEILWLDKETHDAAISALLTARKRKLSLVDCASFEAMRRYGVRRVFTLDADFSEQGFESLPT